MPPRYVSAGESKWRQQEFVLKTGYLAALAWMCLFIIVSGSHAATASHNRVSLDLGNCVGDSQGQASRLTKLLQDNPHVSYFRMTWVYEFGSTSAAGAIVYNRKAHMLRLRTTGGYSARTSAPGGSLTNNYLYTQVNDAKLFQLAKDTSRVASISGSFDTLSHYGCRRYKIKMAYWF